MPGGRAGRLCAGNFRCGTCVWIRVGGAGSGPGLGVEGLEHPWYRRDLGSQCGQVRKRKTSGASWITSTHACEGSASPVNLASPVSFVVSYKITMNPLSPGIH